MSFEIEPTLSQSTSRRTIVKAGARLAYAAPLVAASMHLQSARANGVVSGGTGLAQCWILYCAITCCWVQTQSPLDEATCNAWNFCSTGGACRAWGVTPPSSAPVCAD